jgi:hypothetical protein
MKSEAPPTGRQVYALAAALCELVDEPFPETRGEASALIERLRRELGHPAPALDDSPRRPRARSRVGGGGAEKLARAIAAELAKEMR